ncbi:MAG: tetratricopeptide repeat protein [Bacteroidales bacterium]|jgi:tetratricopeptide (TPR) repeat protein
MKKRIFLMATIMTLVAVCAFGQSARKYYKAGVEFVDNLRYDDAIVQFTNALGLEPSNPDYYYVRGQAYEKLSKYAEAKADFEKALVFAPKDVDAMISLGAVSNKLGKYDEALKVLNHVSTLDKRNSKVYPEKVMSLYYLNKYDQALQASDTAIIIKDTPMDYYWRGLIYIRLKNNVLGEKELRKSISKDRKLAEPRIALADLLISSNPKEAMDQCNEVIKNNDRNTEAYLERSKVYRKNLDYPSAINDISKTILIDSVNPAFYYERGKCYQKFNQHTNAINDFSKTISLNAERKAEDPDVYYSRAKSYEEIMDYDKARADYNKITFLSKYDAKAREMLELSQKRLYELNRETDPPEISVISPVPVKDTVEIKGDKTALLISGTLKDKSKIKSFKINNESVILVEKNGENDFLANITVNGVDKITFSAIDDYDNEKVLNYVLKRTETNPPKIIIVAPYTTEEGQVILDTPTPNIAIQGKISDESKIKSITVGNFTASYNPNDLNPAFTATLDISNLNKFTVVAEDIYGNRQETEFTLNREGAGIAATNPMGRTWVVFIENSGYETFASLDGPIKDISTMQRALANYQIHNIIYKKDMTKAEMERFFNIELRDQVKKNQVKSLMIYYAGHGKYINNVGYWIPVDAKRDDEFTYFNINSLKAGLQGYSDVVVHTLVVSDACESGPGFYSASRAANEAPTCDNTLVAGAKSAQVFSSAGEAYELASDNSKFAATFANTLMNNKNACIPIETVVKSVTAVIASDNKGQKPKFGRIQGLEDMLGTFFFITK